jgi:phosphopantothenoylcysteine decarboxylase / phosphopantothenate---cysteine ligase
MRRLAALNEVPGVEREARPIRPRHGHPTDCHLRRPGGPVTILTMENFPTAGSRAPRILLGVSGGIAAYKAAELVRLLVAGGAEVQVVMTAGARQFVTPLTFQALSGRAVRDDLWDPAAEAAMGHIELARWADLVLLAPASADLLARLAHGLADDLLTTLLLATDRPVHVAPAMNRLMWANAATQANVAVLRARGVVFHGPADGAQACGETGPGRLVEPPALAAAALAALAPGAGRPGTDWRGKRVVITAGPTREKIDPVRFISNCSSGKMGYAIAAAAQEAGAQVVIVSGPVALPVPPGVERISVESAAQMHEAVHRALPGTDVFIAAAAVADYAPECCAEQKIKKGADTMELRLRRAPDILASVAALAAPARPFVVGFAAETCDVEANARDKLVRKRLDLIAANQVGAGRAFDTDDNELQVLWNGGAERLALQDKRTLAAALVALIDRRMQA